MITRDQIYTMLKLRNRENTVFSDLPDDLIREISDHGQAPNTGIATALKYAAYARKEDVKALLVLLDEDPSLLLQAGNVQTPGGDEVRRVTLYEFLLGAGDFELAGIVQSYFANIDNGEQERIRQYERYRPHIESMLTQKPYNLGPLIQLIKDATPEQVTALLNKDMTGEDDLCTAIKKFRKDWAPKVLTKPCMHYNYNSFKHALELLDLELNNLQKANNFDKINLIKRLLIGFEMRRFPGIDRCVMAQGLYYVIEENEPLTRTYTRRINCRQAPAFPITVSDDSNDGLGVDYYIRVEVATLWGDRPAVSCFRTHVEQKKSNLQNLCNQPQLISRSGV